MRTTTRMTRGRATALLATAAATALVLTGCSSGGNAADNGGGEISGTITLQTWALTPTYTGYLNGVIKDFEQAQIASLNMGQPLDHATPADLGGDVRGKQPGGDSSDPLRGNDGGSGEHHGA